MSELVKSDLSGHFERMRLGVLLSIQDIAAGANKSPSLDNLSNQLSNFSKESKARISRVLESLQFPSMDGRHVSIPIAKHDTYRRIFGMNVPATPIADCCRDDLVRWFQNGSGIYWITGKPGSGKSTLIKCLYGTENTKRLLTT